MKINYSNLYKTFLIVDKYYSKFKDRTSINKEELDLAFNSSYLLKEEERKEITSLIDSTFSTEISNEEQLDTLLQEHKRRSVAGDMARVSLDFEEGLAKVEDLEKLYAEFVSSEVEVKEAEYVNMDLEELHTSQIATNGLRWRLHWLNQSLGSLRQGDFGFILARPEAGKTTFLVSEVTHMVGQTDKDIIFLNNEEQSSKVAIRCYQAVLGLTTKELFKDLKGNQKRYEELTGNRIKMYSYEESSTKSAIEDVLRDTDPSLIVIDQLDKVRGFKADRHDLEMKQIYNWARELAKKYAPVIGVSQAGGSAENKLWLSMDDVDSSKTAKQGEADWILGIGKETDDTSRLRFLNITKNKLLGDADTLPEQRHGQRQVLILPEIARFSDT
jgi:replicative DNA helicase